MRARRVQVIMQETFLNKPPYIKPGQFSNFNFETFLNRPPYIKQFYNFKKA
jgi:hypothetical protein